MRVGPHHDRLARRHQPHQALPHPLRPGPRGGRCLLHACPWRDAGLGGGKRLRQVHHRAARAAPDRADGRAGGVRGAGHHRAARRRAAPLATTHADRVPGPVRLAQPAHDGRRHAGRALADPRLWRRRQAPCPRGRAVAARRPAAGACPPLPARVLRRPAPAHRHRPGAGAGAGFGGVRRAGLGTGRVRAGAGGQPAGRPAGSGSACPTCSSRTTWPW